MDIQDIRRQRLREYIAKNYPRPGFKNGNVSSFAYQANMQQSQVADMLDGRRPFGEKVARKIERKIREANLPEVALDSGDGIAAPSSVDRLASSRISDVGTLSYHGVQLTEEAARFAEEWSKLRSPLKAQIQAMVETLVAEQVREVRNKPRKGPEDRPSA